MLLYDLLRDNPDTLIKVYESSNLVYYETGERILENIPDYWLKYLIEAYVEEDDFTIKAIILY